MRCIVSAADNETPSQIALRVGIDVRALIKQNSNIPGLKKAGHNYLGHNYVGHYY